MNRAITANYLGILEKCLQHYGVPNFLKSIKFEHKPVNESWSYLNYEEFSFVIKEAYKQSQCAHLGFLFGEHLSIANHGFLGYAAMTSPIFRTAIQIFLRFLNTRTSLLRGHLYEIDGNKAFVEFHPLTQDPLLNRFIIETAIVHLIKQRHFLINSHAPCLQIDIAYKKPTYSPVYQRVLHAPIQFDAKKTRVWFDAQELNAPINFADDASFNQAKIQLQSQEEHLVKETELPVQIKEILNHHQNLSQLNMQEVAKLLCMSPRTLRRHLQVYRITYQELFDEIRQQRAKELLINNNHSITEISFLLGFQDVSSFSKAFKRWTQLTPSEYRGQ